MEGKTLQQVLNEPWHYDEVEKHYQAGYDEFRRRHRHNLEELRKRQRTFRKSKNSKHKEEMDFAIAVCERGQERIEHVAKGLSAFKEARAFLIGPATLDSLVEETPDSYDYILQGKLPFDDIFFDFSEPIEIGLVGTRKRITAIGAEMHPVSNVVKHSWCGEMANSLGLTPVSSAYMLKFFYRAGQEAFGGLSSFSTEFQLVKSPDSSKPSIIIAGEYYDETNGKNTCTTFAMNPKSGKTYWNTKSYGEETALSLREKNLILEGGQNIENIEQGREILRLPNLAVNLINYINSHNVHVVQRNRGKYVPYEGQDVSILPSHKRPFFLVTVRDDIVDESQKEGKNWDLQWRVYVRGHNVKYRNPDGSIRLVTWRRPHIRGPDDAPWRENRYEVLAKKLEQERQMYREHGVEE